MFNEKKMRIQRSFNRAFKTYDAYSYMPAKICKELLDQLKKIELNYEVIADFACGTGVSTQEISSVFSFNSMYAIDFCNSLLDEAQKKIRNAKVMFILADFDDFLFFENSLQLAFCNMGLQWSLDLRNTFKTFSYQLIPSGIMAFSIPLKGTFNELGENSRNQFYPLEIITNFLTVSGFSILSYQEKVFIDEFKTLQEAVRSIKYIGANCLVLRKKSDLSAKPILKFTDKEIVKLTYRIGFFVCRKI